MCVCVCLWREGGGGEVWFFIDQRGHAALIGTCNCNANKKQENMAKDYTFSISLVNKVHVYKIYIVIHTSDREQKGIDICNLIFFSLPFLRSENTFDLLLLTRYFPVTKPHHLSMH